MKNRKKIETYEELLTKARSYGLQSIESELTQMPCEGNEYSAIALATIRTAQGVYKSYGEASPQTVKSGSAQYIISKAETRAKRRALRDMMHIENATPYPVP